jgi:hypothetical protein
MTAQIRQIPPASAAAPTICGLPGPGRQQQSAPAEGPLNGGVGHLVRTSRPTRHVPFSGPRGRRRDSVDELRAFLPDPQLHRRLRESELQLLALVAQPPLGLRLPTIGAGQRTVHPGLARVDEPVPPVAHRRRGHPCRRAASASDNSPFNTANTTWICSSTDTCRDGFCCLLTQPSFPTPQLNPLPESLTHSKSGSVETYLAGTSPLPYR